MPDCARLWSCAVRDLVCVGHCARLRTRSVRLGAEAGHPTRSRGSFHPLPPGVGVKALPLCPAPRRPSLPSSPSCTPPFSLSSPPAFALSPSFSSPLSLYLSFFLPSSRCSRANTPALSSFSSLVYRLAARSAPLASTSSRDASLNGIGRPCLARGDNHEEGETPAPSLARLSPV